MNTLIFVGIGLGVGIIGCVISKGKNKNTTKLQVFNISDRAVKQKRYQSALNERTKGMFK